MAGPPERPLAGRTVLVTRAREQQSGLAEAIRRLGGEVWDFPTIAIADPEDWGPVDAALARLESFAWLVFTSQNGVRRFFQRLEGLRGPGAALPPHLRIAAVGRATAAALAGYGLEPAVVPREYRGRELAPALAPHLRPGDRVLLAQARDPAWDVAGDLRRLGAEVTQVAVYRTVPAAGDPEPLRAALAAGRIDYATFTSPSTVRNLLLALPDGVRLLAPVTVACIGPTTAAAAREAGLRVDLVPPEATAEGLAAALVAHAAQGDGQGRRREAAAAGTRGPDTDGEPSPGR
ncbi:MAG: uroporphyrinogen-III synthase [Bacillota bacterium]